MHYQYTWIRSFHYTASLGNITKAANFLGLASSTLSHQITDLEKYFKVKLFYRSSNKILLTNIGESLKKKTNLYFEQEEEIKKFLIKVRNRVNKIINVGSEMPVRVLAIIKDFNETEKKVNFNFFFERNNRLWDLFFRNKVDLLVMNQEYFNYKCLQNKKDFSEIKFVPFYQDEMVFIAHHDHEVAEGQLALEDIFTYKILLNHQSSSVRKVYQKVIKKIELVPPQTAQVSSREGVFLAVQKKMGLAPILKSELDLYSAKSFKVITPVHKLLKEDDLKVDNFLYYHKNIEGVEIVKKFIEAVKQSR